MYLKFVKLRLFDPSDMSTVGMNMSMELRWNDTDWGKLKYWETSTELFISPSGISELDCATTKKNTAERSISIGRESLQVFFCTRGFGVLPGSTARGSRDEKWRSQ